MLIDGLDHFDLSPCGHWTTTLPGWMGLAAMAW